MTVLEIGLCEWREGCGRELWRHKDKIWRLIGMGGMLSDVMVEKGGLGGCKPSG